MHPEQRERTTSPAQRISGKTPRPPNDRSSPPPLSPPQPQVHGGGKGVFARTIWPRLLTPPEIPVALLAERRPEDPRPPGPSTLAGSNFPLLSVLFSLPSIWRLNHTPHHLSSGHKFPGKPHPFTSLPSGTHSPPGNEADWAGSLGPTGGGQQTSAAATGSGDEGQSRPQPTAPSLPLQLSSAPFLLWPESHSFLWPKRHSSLAREPKTLLWPDATSPRG